MPSANTVAQNPGGKVNPLWEQDALLTFFSGLGWLCAETITLNTHHTVTTIIAEDNWSLSERSNLMKPPHIE
jgi:hypothetical protein